MTAYKRVQPPQSFSEAVKETKAKRQAVLDRIRKQRAQTATRTNRVQLPKTYKFVSKQLKLEVHGVLAPLHAATN